MKTPWARFAELSAEMNSGQVKSSMAEIAVSAVVRFESLGIDLSPPLELNGSGADRCRETVIVGCENHQVARFGQ